MLNILQSLSAVKKPQERNVGRVYGPGERDALTGVANQDAFQRIVEYALAGGQTQGCLILVDVDRMQKINEQFGSKTGDIVLRRIAKVLQENFRCGDGIGRLEEDTFGIWVEGLSADRVSGIRRRIAVVNDKLLHGESDFPIVTLSAGVAWGESGESYEELYKQAQKVLHRVKGDGRCGCEIYTNRV